MRYHSEHELESRIYSEAVETGHWTTVQANKLEAARTLCESGGGRVGAGGLESSPITRPPPERHHLFCGVHNTNPGRYSHPVEVFVI